MANKDNFKPVPGVRDDDFSKPKDTGMGRPEDQGRDRGTDDRNRDTGDRNRGVIDPDLEEDTGPLEKGR